MLKNGILNPAINSLISRTRHTNTLVISDRGFPFFPTLETIDLSLVDDIPTVLQVLNAIRPNFIIGEIHMANEFKQVNTEAVQDAFFDAMEGVKVSFRSHDALKLCVPEAIGLIRTGDTIQYANMILVSA